MGLRGFGIQTLTGSAQPLVGTLLTAAVNPSPDQATGSLAAGNANSQATLPITAGTASLFRKGDRVLVAPAATFAQGQTGTTGADQGVVQSINTSGNTITVNGLQKVHASGETVVLSIQASRIRFGIVNAHTMYVGGDSTVSSTSAALADEVAAGTAYDIGISSTGDVFGTGGYWVSSASASDSYLASVTTI